MRAAITSYRNRQSGTAAIEFAIGSLILVPLLIGTVELGITMYQAMAVYNAVEAGTLYAMKNGWDQAAISNAVVNASTVADITATPVPSTFFGCPGAWGITPTAQDSTCANGAAAGQYIQVNASLPHTTIFANSFGLPDTFTATSVVRTP